MSLILCLETSTKTCSVAVGRDGKVLSYREISKDHYSHSENLLPFVQETITEAGITLADLKAVAVSKGPGSYTGLRIGTSAAKGICYALEIPLISINSLQVLAQSFQNLKDKDYTLKENFLLCPMIDARRMEVYTAFYNQKCEQVIETKALIIDKDSFKDLNQNAIHFFGDGAEKCKEVLGANKNFFFHEDIHPNAQAMILFATALYQQKSFEDLVYFEPFYLKDFIATTPKKLV